MYEVTSTNGECIALPNSFANTSGSVKTTDCITLSRRKDCYSFHSNYVIQSDERTLITKDTPYRYVNSFQECTNLEKEEKVNVDINIYETLGRAMEPEFIYSVRNVCSCTDFPKESEETMTYGTIPFFGMKLYGKCIRLYENQKCQGSHKTFGKFGDNPNLLWMDWETYKSFEPCETPKQCVK